MALEKLDGEFRRGSTSPFDFRIINPQYQLYVRARAASPACCHIEPRVEGRSPETWEFPQALLYLSEKAPFSHTVLTTHSCSPDTGRTLQR